VLKNGRQNLHARQLSPLLAQRTREKWGTRLTAKNHVGPHAFVRAPLRFAGGRMRPLLRDFCHSVHTFFGLL
jgi:hypothetical protein